MRREHLHPVGQAKQALDARVLLAGTLRTAKVRPADVTDEEGIAGEHQRGFWTAQRVHHQQRDRFGAMPERVDDVQLDLPHPHDLAIAQRLEGKVDRGSFMQVEGSTSGSGKASVARDVVGVQASIDDRPDGVAALSRQVELGLDLPQRVDHGRIPTGARGDEVRRAPELIVEKRLEVHALLLWLAVPATC